MSALVSSQGDYKESAYEDSSWELVGEAPRGEDFFPLQIKVVGSAELMRDPMFEDFGGTTKGEAKERWHLSDQLAAQHDQTQANRENEAKKHRLTDEELAALKAEAFELGRVQGIEEAVDNQTKRLQEIEGRVHEVLKDFKTQLDEQQAVIAQQSASLAVHIGQRIVGHAVEINPEYIIPIIREALKLSGGAVVKKIRVSRQDHEFIEVVGIAKQFKEFDGSWQFEVDDSIRAGCVLESSAGQVDFDLDRAWERVRDNVLTVIRQDVE